MSIREYTFFEAVCDRCGRPGLGGESREDAMRSYSGWSYDDGVHTCDKCHNQDREDACGERREGHNWDDEFEDWKPGRDGKPDWRMRYCLDCGYTERQDQGQPWRNYREEPCG